MLKHLTRHLLDLKHQKFHMDRPIKSVVYNLFQENRDSDKTV